MSNNTNSNTPKPPTPGQPSELQQAVRGVMEEVLPALAALQKANAPAPVSYGRGRRDLGPRCLVCGQYERACKKEHVDLIVWPRNEYLDFFPGVHINGVKYISPNEHTPVPVPKDAVGGILHIVEQYNERERINQVGHKKRGGRGLGNVKSPMVGDLGWS